MIGWAMAAGLVLGAPALKETRKLADPPAGEWAIERVEFSGTTLISRDRPADRGLTLRILPTSRELAGKAAGPLAGRQPVTFFDAGGVLAVDINPGDPERVQKGIWKVDGDTLLICEAPHGRPRPTEFTAPKGSARALWVLRRVSND